MGRVQRFLERAASTGEPILIATDFDGTLTPVVDRAEDARLAPRVRHVLGRLAHDPRVHLAVLTGRSLDDVRLRLDGIGPIWISAEHGSLLVDPRARVHRSADSVPLERFSALTVRAREIARVFRGARVETKELGVALHFREVAPPKHETLVEMFRLACAAYGAKVLAGRCVLEGRFGGSDKGLALARILFEMPRDVTFVYAGDDLTDEPALSLASVAENGLGLYVRSQERPSPTTRVSGLLDGPAEWLQVLAVLADVLSTGQRHAS